MRKPSYREQLRRENLARSRAKRNRQLERERVRYAVAVLDRVVEREYRRRDRRERAAIKGSAHTVEGPVFDRAESDHLSTARCRLGRLLFGLR